MQSALRLAIVLAGSILGAPAWAQSTAGSLDPTFGTGGIATAARQINFVGNARQQPDGKIVVVAAIQDPPRATLACGLIRFLPNGQLDPSFGNGGVATSAPFGNFINEPFDLAFQPDGKILVTGGGESADGSLNPAFISRFTPAGQLDPTFGQGGTTLTSFGSTDLPQVMLLQPDGKIVVAGTTLPPGYHVPAQVLLARYDSAGVLDPTFGAGGKVGGLLGTVTALALQDDGKLRTNNGAPFLRLLQDGTIDRHNIGGALIAEAHNGTGVFTRGNRYVLAGTEVEFGDRHDIDLKMMRSFQDGSPDPAFSSPPIDFGPEGPHAIAYEPVSVAVQQDGRLLAGVPVSDPEAGAEFGIERSVASGGVDEGFGTAGQVITVFPKANGALLYTLLVQRDGKIVAVGLTLPTSTLGPYQLQLARYLAK